jgi:hypothetical protein
VIIMAIDLHRAGLHILTQRVALLKTDVAFGCRDLDGFMNRINCVFHSVIIFIARESSTRRLIDYHPVGREGLLTTRTRWAFAPSLQRWMQRWIISGNDSPSVKLIDSSTARMTL